MTNKCLLAVIDVLLILMFWGLIKKVAYLGGKAFALEWIAIIVLLILTVFGLVSAYSGRKTGWALLLLVFTLTLLNFLLMKFGIQEMKFWSLTFIVTLIGFLITLVKNPEACKECEVEPEPVVEGYNNGKDKVYKNFEPGKYVASKTGKKFHVPKCEWAKKINPKKMVWFDDKKQAKSKGYGDCNCTK